MILFTQITLKKYSLGTVFTIKNKKQIILCKYNMILFIVYNTPIYMSKYVMKQMFLKDMTLATLYAHACLQHTHVHTSSETLTLAFFSSSESGVELPVKSSEN